MNISEQSNVTTISVDEWNKEISARLLPDSVLLIIYLVVGVLGNSAVLYIYTFRLRGIIEDRIFIPFLAFFDLMTCAIGTSTSFAVNVLPVKFYNDEACKIGTFFLMVCTAASISLLLVIAVNRYMKICKPFKGQMTAQLKKLTLMLVICSSLFVSWPCFLFYGSKEIIDDRTKATGHRCTSVRGPWSTTEPLVYKTVILVFVVVILVSLVLLYLTIAKTVFKQMNISRNLHHVSTSACSPHFKKKTNMNATTPVVQCASNTKTLSSSTCTQAAEVPVIATRQDATQRPDVRLALIFMLITLVFVICFIPKVILMVYESRNENFWIELDNAEMGGYRFLYTLIYINSIVNPIIYGFFDRRFRREVRLTLRLCARKNSE